MPTYQYMCKHCGYVFEKALTIQEHERTAKPTCPKCRSHQVAQRPADFQAVTSAKT